MPYQREISREHKACFLFLLDQSFSMDEPLGSSAQRKCDELAKAVNGWLYNMAIRASGDEGIRDWMDVGVIGYRTDQQANPIIEPALVGPLAGRRAGFDHRHRQLSGADRHRGPADPRRRHGRMMQFPSESPSGSIRWPRAARRCATCCTRRTRSSASGSSSIPTVFRRS